MYKKGWFREELLDVEEEVKNWPKWMLGKEERREPTADRPQKEKKDTRDQVKRVIADR